MSGFTVAAAASIAAGLAVGIATTVGITLAVADDTAVRVQAPARPALPYQVQYGDRCFHGHCLHW
ncbi:DUF2613 family protein [Mycobacterium paraintracellulare]|uniref:DUF2613 domain-containing protein n=1 Tax=Mycobacterium paraintracellulare TaxID=1138383 RepID=A0ABM7K5Q6_9MYCO|nr:DUF2613 family protein [Mycobacterium paraintracellulare]AFC56444.1 hypothetical protein OCQ_49330 [Mycobacterium paraintracellulare]OSC26320.1 hypothetical protein B8W68_12350 [Mycobacterium paraintracellulare]BBY69359.1 hypothetical protein MPRI_15460 [Mycobacterium paraintracellulare]